MGSIHRQPRASWRRLFPSCALCHRKVARNEIYLSRGAGYPGSRREPNLGLCWSNNARHRNKEKTLWKCCFFIVGWHWRLNDTFTHITVCALIRSWDDTLTLNDSLHMSQECRRCPLCKHRYFFSYLWSLNDLFITWSMLHSHRRLISLVYCTHHRNVGTLH